MIAFVLSCNDSLRELNNLGYFSFDDINLFDKSLSCYQDLCIEYGEKTTKYFLKNNDISTVKKVIAETEEKYSLFFYENCFFDFSITDIISFHEQSESFITSFYNDEMLVVSLISNMKFKKNLLEKFSFNTVDQFLKAYCEAQAPYFYFKFLDTYDSYKRLNHDILNYKTNVYLSCVAKGVFTDGTLPKGDYTIIPPVYISEKSQIENGAVIGPSSVILKNSLVAEKTIINKSVICEGAFISRGCLVENSLCGKDSTVKRGGAALSDCVLGFDSVLGDDMLVENGAVVLPEAKIFNYESGKEGAEFLFVENSCFKNLNVVKACKLGYAFSKAFNSPAICIGNDDNASSSVIKLAFISGAASGGCDCYDIGASFLSKLFYTEVFCDLDYGVFFVFESDSVTLRIYNNRQDKLKNSDLYNLFYFFKSTEFDFPNLKIIKKIKQIKGISRLYIRDLKLVLPEKITSVYNIDCNNSSIKKVVESIMKTVPSDKKNVNNISFSIDDSGCKLSCFYSGKMYGENQLIEALDKLCIEENESKLISSLYRKDAIVLLFKIISFLEKKDTNTKHYFDFLDNFKEIDKELLFTERTGETLSKLLFNQRIEYKNGKLYIINKGSEVAFHLNTQRKILRLTSKCNDAEASKEISDTLDLLLKDINKV